MEITAPPGLGRREHRKRAKAGARWQDSGVMFTTSVGPPLDTSHGGRDFRAPYRKSGIEGVWAPRELRQTFVSVMSESPVAVDEIARLTRHSSSGRPRRSTATNSVPSSPPAPTSWTRYSFSRVLPYAVYHRIGTLGHEYFGAKLTAFALLTLRIELKCAYPH